MIKLGNLRPIVFLIIVISTLYSCVPRKHVVYFSKEDTTQRELPPLYEPTIQADDRVSILVTSIDKQASSFFSFSANDNSTNAPTYLVNSKGEIDIPLIGVFHIAGLTTNQAKDSLKRRFENYITGPTVIVALKTFKIITLGSISPGVHIFDHEKVTILEAIAVSGDLTTDGKRQNIMVIRLKGDGREYGFVDITSKSIMTSPYYYLHPNDIIYVEPMTRTRLAAGLFYVGVIGTISGLITLAVVLLDK